MTPRSAYRAILLKVGLPFLLLSWAFVYVTDNVIRSRGIDPDELVFTAAAALALTIIAARLLMRQRASERRSAHEIAHKTALYEMLPGPVFALDLDGRVVSWNQRVLDLTGLDAERLAGRPAEDLIHADDRAAIKASIMRVIAEGRMESEPGRLLRADGTTVPYLWSGAPVLGPDGKVGHIVGFGQDLSEERAAQQSLRSDLREIEDVLAQTVKAISLAMEARDPYTAGHQQKVTQLAVEIGRRLGYDAARLTGLELAAQVHDVGKLAVPADILTVPRRLTGAETDIMRTHVEWGYRILSDIAFPWPLAEIVRQHHERLDGSGYPRGLAGEAILQEARIVAVADVVEAISSHRPFRPAQGWDAALEELRRGSGTLYDSAVVAACLGAFADGFVFREPRSLLHASPSPEAA